MKELPKIQTQQHGFSLLEALMALFVLTVGLLGVAGMNAQSMRTGYVAAQSMAAISKSEELFERMRANPGGIASYGGLGQSFNCTSTNLSCSVAEMAADDLFIWTDEVNKEFPGAPVIDIQVLNNAGAVLDPDGVIWEVTLSISWDSRGENYNYTTISEVIFDPPAAP